MKRINKLFIFSAVIVVCLYIFVTLFLIISLEPLHFSIFNQDVNKHEVAIEIFDINNKSIFKEIYELGPKEKIDSPEITKKKGEYIFKVTLNKEVTNTYRAKVDIGRSAVHIWLYSNVGGKIVPLDIVQIV